MTLYEKSTVTVTRDIVPVAGINNDSFVLLVNPSFPAKTVPEFIAYAKANPGKINLASNGTGNLTHLSGELFRMMTAIEVVHVPYRGTPAAHSALMAGDVHAMFDAVGSSLPHIQSGVAPWPSPQARCRGSILTTITASQNHSANPTKQRSGIIQRLIDRDGCTANSFQV